LILEKEKLIEWSLAKNINTEYNKKFKDDVLEKRGNIFPNAGNQENRAEFWKNLYEYFPEFHLFVTLFKKGNLTENEFFIFENFKLYDITEIYKTYLYISKVHGLKWDSNEEEHSHTDEEIFSDKEIIENRLDRSNILIDNHINWAKLYSKEGKTFEKEGKTFEKEGKIKEAEEKFEKAKEKFESAVKEFESAVKEFEEGAKKSEKEFEESEKEFQEIKEKFNKK
jgi:tetratricopeptide (TPR) repeat protein